MATQADEICAQLEDEGYHIGAPSLEAAEIDSGVAANATCEVCGHTGMDYEPYTRPAPHRSYRVVAACRECGSGFEF